MEEEFEDETIKNNQMIAAFVGLILTWINTNSYFEPNDYDLEIECPDGFNHDEQLMYLYEEEQPEESYKFDTDWNWLMVAIDKIESLGFTFVISKDRARYFNANYMPYCDEYFIGDNKKESAYKAVVAFINWYNKTIKQ